MALVVRKTDPLASKMGTLVNGNRLQAGAGSSFHLDAAEYSVSAATATDLATALASANQSMAVYLLHVVDVLAHKVAGTPPTLVVGTTLATGITLANAIKASYNTHRASTVLHYNADSTNVVTAANATDLASLLTLVNDIKAQLNAHMLSAPSGQSARVVAA